MAAAFPGSGFRHQNAAPAARRQFFAAPDEGITYICMQVKEGSLGGFTADDAVVY